MVPATLYITPGETVAATGYTRKNMKGKQIHNNISSVYPFNFQCFVDRGLLDSELVPLHLPAVTDISYS